MILHLWPDQEPVEFRERISFAEGYAPLEQRTSLDTRIRAMHDAPWLNPAALRRSHEAFCFLTYIFLYHFYSLIFSPLYRAYLDGFDSLGMYCVEEGAPLLVFGSLLDSVVEMFWVTKPSPSS